MTTTKRIRPFEKRYDELANGCWEWNSGKSDGYGAWKDPASGKRVRAHREAYRRAHGWIPPHESGLQLDHLCRNPGCVNPAHLELVTHKENLARGRHHGREQARCKHGHRLSGKNLYVRPVDGARVCRRCTRVHG